jgi:hypothetical protein
MTCLGKSLLCSLDYRKNTWDYGCSTLDYPDVDYIYVCYNVQLNAYNISKSKDVQDDTRSAGPTPFLQGIGYQSNWKKGQREK